ncbi:RnfABCDGE type electron transport complex subunit B [Pseudomonas typographi]|uniref:RnfABCDGE type electron transport complex subunit B n=1 Tax=Pseudomonas typographi TaxID=2715964 RepID=UPI00168A019A|nr:RnfABCDGE type electron transport complex subunit B [Pseudomonas typographi]MBD1550631.1 RnfABCDGE type electron transport complex subunit B [Pseudomonas typographi]
MNLIQRIDALLPQTQCGKCGHPGCKPYAEGIARGEPINQCPPGGTETIVALAHLLQVPVLPLAPGRGDGPAQVAFIREAECIGCTKCLQVCPVDAIVGAAKLMHTVLIDECTGCDLCLAPCPVDCIDLLPLASSTAAPLVGGSAHTPAEYQARERRRQRARLRFEQRNARLRRDEERIRAERAARVAPPAAAVPAAAQQASKQAKVDVAMGRAQLSRAQKAFGATPSSDQQAMLASLEQALQQAEQRLASLQAAPSPNSATPSGVADKRAKVQLAMAKAELARLQRQGAPAEQLEQARQTLAALALQAAPRVSTPR